MNNKFNLGWYMFALCGGLFSGLCFSRAQYYKGQADAYEEIVNKLEEVQEQTEKYLEEHKNEEESQ